MIWTTRRRSVGKSAGRSIRQSATKSVRKRAGRTAVLLLSATTAWSAIFVSLPTQPVVYAAPKTAQLQIAQADQGMQSSLQFIKEDIVTSGAVIRTYKWQPVSSSGQKLQTTDLRVLVIDLHNPYVKLNVMNGKGGQLNSNQSILGMARETGAVAGVNGSFFHMDRLGNPLGPQITEQELVVSPLYLPGWYSFGVTEDRKPVIGEYSFYGSVFASRGPLFELRGINKPLMRDQNNDPSHLHSIFMYTSAWGPYPREGSNLYKPTEVLVVDGIVTMKSEDAALDVEIPENGYLLRGEGRGAEYLQRYVDIGEPVHVYYHMIDRHTGEMVDPASFQMLIAGQTLLVDEGKPSAFTANVQLISGSHPAARTAIGYSADGRYVYMLTADRTSGSRGMTLSELQQAMIQLGVWRGINLDGGGSTTMVARPLGETTTSLVNRPSNTTMRQVVNGIGVYTTAPEGELAGLIFDEIPFLFAGERVQFKVRGYDEYYNPLTNIDLSAPGFTFDVTEGYGRFEGGDFIPAKKGLAKITIRRGGMEASTEVEIIDRKDIDRLAIDGVFAPISEGSMIELKVKSQLKDGRSREVPADAIEWRIEGFEGYIEDGVLTVEKVEEYATARLIATYDGLSTTKVLPTYVRTIWANFDTVMPPISLQLIDPESVIDYTITNTHQGQELSSNMLIWQYDFSKIRQFSWTAPPKAAFEFDLGAGVEVPGNPNEMLIDILGDGKSGKLWLEATDASGQDHQIMIGTVDWTGWRTVTVDMSSLQIEHPLSIRRLVHESPSNPLPNIDLAFITEEELEKMIDHEKVRGQLAVDNIIFQSVHIPPEPTSKTIQMQIDNPYVLINGQSTMIDQAPVVIDQTTMVPIRFVMETMDGEVLWDEDSGKVTLIRGKDYIEMWLNEQEMNFNGRKVIAPVAPMAMNNRTLVPVRVLFEQLGWDVIWDGETRSVTIIDNQSF